MGIRVRCWPRRSTFSGGEVRRCEEVCRCVRARGGARDGRIGAAATDRAVCREWPAGADDEKGREMVELLPPAADRGASVLLQGISELVTNDPAAGPGLLGPVSAASLIIDDGRIAWVGPETAAPAADTMVDLGGRAVLPGWVDSHSHVVFAGDRAAEFSARMSGQPYRAGGMQATVDATRAAHDHELLAGARRHRAEMIAGGTTCMETKTGYGLTLPDEVRLATTARTAGFDEITFLGAHVVPPE